MAQFLSVSIASGKMTVSSGGAVGFSNATFSFDDASKAAFLSAIGLTVGQAGGVQAYSANITAIAGIAFSNDIKSFLAAADDPAARAALGLAIGTNVQAYSSVLTTYAAINPGATIQSLLGAADAPGARSVLGVVIGTNVQAYSANLATYAGIAPSSLAQTFLISANTTAAQSTLGLTIGTNVQAWNGTLDTISGKSVVGTGALVAQSYVDALAGGMGTKETVRVATTVNGNINTAFANGQTVDGVVLATGDRILLKDQSPPNQWQNGIYVVAASGAPARAADFDSWNEIPGMLISVQEGTANADSLWLSSADQGGTLGTTAITFTNPWAFALLAANNFSDLGDVAMARQNLGVKIGVNVQAYSANLLLLAGIAFSANILSFLAAGDYAAARSLIGLAIGTNVPAQSVAGKYRFKTDGTFQLWNADQNLFFTLTTYGAAGSERLKIATSGET